jgi:hypothetical protein
MPTPSQGPPGRGPSRWRWAFLGLLLQASLVGGSVQAAPLINGLGGPAGYGEGVVGPCDDCSSGALPLPFSVNFYGITYNSFFVNNNGNITFDSSYSSFQPNAFPSLPMIAPFWQDVDTRTQPQGGVTYYNIDDPDRVIATWNLVGRYNNLVDKQNDFQAVLTNRGNGSFQIDFIYNQLQWSTSDSASFPFVGLASGTGDAVELPGSLSSDSLDKLNLNGGQSGFLVQNGQPSQIYPTPGPVPMAGAFAALAWSRKLRGRIRSYRAV